jgi:hypothetical protein
VGWRYLASASMGVMSGSLFVLLCGNYSDFSARSFSSSCS